MVGGIALIVVLIFCVVCIYGQDFMEHRERMAQIKRDEERARLENSRLEEKNRSRNCNINLDK